MINVFNKRIFCEKSVNSGMFLDEKSNDSMAESVYDGYIDTI
mgnify:FL=1